MKRGVLPKISCRTLISCGLLFYPTTLWFGNTNIRCHEAKMLSVLLHVLDVLIGLLLVGRKSRGYIPVTKTTLSLTQCLRN